MMRIFKLSHNGLLRTLDAINVLRSILFFSVEYSYQRLQVFWLIFFHGCTLLVQFISGKKACHARLIA
jgi:hypothetical protein